MKRIGDATPFYQAGGTLSADAPSYIPRKADRDLLTHVIAGDVCYLLTSRQMGKSSLVVRTIAHLRKKRIHSVFLDLQGTVERGMAAEAFYAGLLDSCIRQLQLPLNLTEWWQAKSALSPVYRFSSFIAEEVVPRIEERLVVFIDEIDLTLNLAFSDDFFAALRAFYNKRATTPAFRRLTFVLLGMASPADLVKDRVHSPFNIGHRIELTDFTAEEVRKLTHGFPLQGNAAEHLLDRVLYWTGGQPYLTQCVCAELVEVKPWKKSHGREECDAVVDTLVNARFLADGLTDDHLKYLRDYLVENNDDSDGVLALYRRVRAGERVPDEPRSPVHSTLKLAGIVKSSSARTLQLRNRIYEHVFDLAWIETELRLRKHPTQLDVHEWKTQVAAHLKDWRTQMTRVGVPSIYAYLAAASVWPVVEAARNGQWAALMTLGSVLTGVGGHLLATRLQGWKDETDAAQQLATSIATEPDLRAELDAVLETLDVVQQAKRQLPEKEQPWFIDTLQAELARYGNLSRFALHVTGPGAIATGNGVAAGAGGVAVGGDVHGSVYVGPSPHDPTQALALYRRELMQEYRHLALRGLDVGASDLTSTQQRLDLAQVYVDLLTTTQVPVAKKEKQGRQPKPRDLGNERETRPLSALEAVITSPRLVLLGDPGSGKSTFLTHLVLCLAAHSLEPPQHWLKRLPGWKRTEAEVVPVIVTLRDFARWVPEKTKKADPSVLWKFIEHRLAAQNLNVVADALHDRLERGRAVVLLDGLDEIPTQQQRTFVGAAVESFARRYPDCRFVVTCRTLSYQDPAWQLSDFQSVTLAPFSAEQIDLFIAAWYGELARVGRIKPDAVSGGIRLLQEAVRRPDLWRLAANPMLLMAMALVHTHKGRLPEARALLYEETIDILLWRWEQLKVSGEDESPRLHLLLAEAGRTDVDLKRVLWQLAFVAHQNGGTEDTEAVADIGESQLSKTLSELHPKRSRDWAQQVIEVMKLRAGLLLERAPEVYSFPHRTFQEYLAGAHLANQPDFAQQATQLVMQGALWREVILLAVGRLVYLSGDTAKPLALVAELCPVTVSDTDTTWRQAWLAGDVLLEMGQNRVQDGAQGRDLSERVAQRLVQLLRTTRLSPGERAAAGDTLARLGDPRFRADALFLPDEPLLGFIEIPAGPFVMGSDKKRDEQAYGDEAPQHELPLARYYMARYPVTGAQYRTFVEQSGHEPEDSDCLRGLDNRPVASITWYEALKYCEWLTERLREWEGMPEPLATLLRKERWQVTLPSEAEWEKAARGTEGRIYPWGDEFDAGKANTDETGIGRPSAVGSFPQGASPYGCQDMAGNVWEWTRSLWGRDGSKPDYGYPYNPNDGRERLDAGDEVACVLRGGSYWNSRRSARCAFRYRLDPYFRDVGSGFRLVLRP